MHGGSPIRRPMAVAGYVAGAVPLRQYFGRSGMGALPGR
ncbi:hypothetical protein B005_3453 [Nocardiopsis alba ATCC BAA-2165]|uniref:Uncharacterized protein n=1 Tax=Nocardiopsis alba (strain ATCC BAA-2165 / BE74) TaxID=1205910 RepID=J7LFM9_NOCAA|nr:hypothetical protein B005_3453 [Nocardiopsis alba ATCC BAA-2165]